MQYVIFVIKIFYVNTGFCSKNLETEGDINIDKIINIYGVENDGIYSCKICGEYLASTDTLDLIEMGRVRF